MSVTPVVIAPPGPFHEAVTVTSESTAESSTMSQVRVRLSPWRSVVSLFGSQLRVTPGTGTG